MNGRNIGFSMILPEGLHLRRIRDTLRKMIPYGEEMRFHT